MENNEELTEEKIKEKLGKPGFLKPIYERNLDFAIPHLDTSKDVRKHNLCRLYNLKRDSKVLLIPNRKELYNDMITTVEKEGLTSIKLLSYVYDRMGSEDPSLTFYIENLEGTGKGNPRVFGWDYVKYGDKDSCKCNEEKQGFINYKIDSPTDYLRLPYTFLIDTVIGLKQFAGEIVKSPISFLEAELFENMIIEKKIPFYKFDGFKAAGKDWRNGVTALTYRYRIDGDQGMLAATQNLLGEIPVIGSVFDQWPGKDSGNSKKLFLTRGIYGGDDYSQNMTLWVNYLTDPPAEECPPDQSTHQSDSITPDETNRIDKKDTDKHYIKVIPYRYGSGIDVFWALFNISHGYAYEMASEIVSKCDVHPGDSVLLSGHSGGVQRSIATARILNDDGIMVEKIYGIAGPTLGYAPSRKTRVVLNRKLLQDFTSAVSRLLKYITLYSLTLNVDWDLDDREVRHNKDEFYNHRTPGFYDGKTRLKYDGFLYDNFEYLYRPHNPEQNH